MLRLPFESAVVDGVIGTFSKFEGIAGINLLWLDIEEASSDLYHFAAAFCGGEYMEKEDEERE